MRAWLNDSTMMKIFILSLCYCYFHCCFMLHTYTKILSYTCLYVCKKLRTKVTHWLSETTTVNVCGVWFLSSHRLYKWRISVWVSCLYSPIIERMYTFFPKHRLSDQIISGSSILHCNIHWGACCKISQQQKLNRKINTCGCKCVCSLSPFYLNVYALLIVLHSFFPSTSSSSFSFSTFFLLLLFDNIFGFETFSFLCTEKISLEWKSLYFGKSNERHWQTISWEISNEIILAMVKRTNYYNAVALRNWQVYKMFRKKSWRDWRANMRKREGAREKERKKMKNDNDSNILKWNQTRLTNTTRLKWLVRGEIKQNDLWKNYQAIFNSL